MTARIELDSASFSYGEKPVLRKVSASIPVGEFTCLLGPNGAGKTTLAQLIAGELAPSTGRVSLYRDVAYDEPAEVRRHVAYLPQNLQDPPFVTVRELVTLGRFSPKRSLGWRVRGKDKEAIEEYIAVCLAESFADRPFNQLSGGEKQRVWLAFCLAQEREFLLLDESLHQMDYSMKELFFRMLSDLTQRGKGVILITHDLQMAMRHGTRMLALRDGELVCDGPPKHEIYSLMVQARRL
jgi:iron complex transport system ATP-binding protein